MSRERGECTSCWISAEGIWGHSLSGPSAEEEGKWLMIMAKSGSLSFYHTARFHMTVEGGVHMANRAWGDSMGFTPLAYEKARPSKLK